MSWYIYKWIIFLDDYVIKYSIYLLNYYEFIMHNKQIELEMLLYINFYIFLRKH